MKSLQKVCQWNQLFVIRFTQYREFAIEIGHGGGVFDVIRLDVCVYIFARLYKSDENESSKTYFVRTQHHFLCAIFLFAGEWAVKLSTQVTFQHSNQLFILQKILIFKIKLTL